VGPNRFISSGPEVILFQYDNDLMQLYKTCTQAMIESEVMGM
jgi:hypothetical protein